MSYAVIADLIPRYVPEGVAKNITDDEAYAEVDETLVNQCLADAETLVDSYLVDVYSLPLASVPEIIKSETCQIARFYVYERKGLLEESPHVKTSFEDALKLLGKIQSGELKMGLARRDDKQIKMTKSSKRGNYLDDVWTGYD